MRIVKYTIAALTGGSARDTTSTSKRMRECRDRQSFIADGAGFTTSGFA